MSSWSAAKCLAEIWDVHVRDTHTHTRTPQQRGPFLAELTGLSVGQLLAKKKRTKIDHRRVWGRTAQTDATRGTRRSVSIIKIYGGTPLAEFWPSDLQRLGVLSCRSSEDTCLAASSVLGLLRGIESCNRKVCGSLVLFWQLLKWWISLSTSV